MINKEKLGEAAELILEAIGEDKTREGLLRTPERVARDWGELFQGYEKDPREFLDRSFDAEGYDEMVIRHNIEVKSFCEHHILPFVGVAWVGYIPDERIVGLDKIDKVVKGYSRRLQNQERLTYQIAEALDEKLNPKGVMVVIEAEHFCMKMRGVNAPCSLTTTSAVRGIFLSKQSTRDEFLRLIKSK
jgi:GTP cyclohydrolase IA